MSTLDERIQAKKDKIAAKRAEVATSIDARNSRTVAALFRARGKSMGIRSADLDRMLALGASARVETGADVQRRVTVTRLATLGLLAFALRKESGHLYVTFDLAGDTVHLVKINVKHEEKARRWAAEFNRLSADRAA